MDNGNRSTELLGTDHRITRGLEVRVNELDNRQCTAEVIWEHSLPEELFGFAAGNIQKLENENFLITTVGDGGTSQEISGDGQLVWEAKYNLNFPNGMLYRANRVSSLYPVAYSIIDKGLDNTQQTYTIYNAGSNSETFIYTITESLDWINSSSGELYISPGESYDLLLDLSITEGINEIDLEIIPLHRPDLLKSVSTIIDSDLILQIPGDINNDGSLDILDIVITTNYILLGQYSYIADVNLDGICNILDIIITINWILDGLPEPDVECIDIDGNSYGTVWIGDQLWMAENLKVTHYNNGDSITHIASEEEWGSMDQGQYGVYDDEPENADILGNLYNWAATGDSRGICPEGWHMPSNDEYAILINFLGGESVAGGKMKEAGLEHWNYYSNQISQEATNESGFTGLPAGHRNTNTGDYIYMGSYGYFWSSTENGDELAWRVYLFDYSSGVGQDTFGKPNGFSVRCVVD